MNTLLNRQAHAAAAAVYGSDAHKILSIMANAAGYDSWSQVPDKEARGLISSLNQEKEKARELMESARPGYCTRKQREKISAIRASMRWRWAYIRNLVKEYGVSDWHDLTVSDADNLIQRLEKIAANMRRRSAASE